MGVVKTNIVTFLHSFLYYVIAIIAYHIAYTMNSMIKGGETESNELYLHRLLSDTMIDNW